MIYRSTARFWRSYSRLPKTVQERAEWAFDRFQADPQHPSLRIHPLRGTDGVMAGHVTRAYVFTFRYSRAPNGERVCEFLDIGTHAIYER